MAPDTTHNSSPVSDETLTEYTDEDLIHGLPQKAFFLDRDGVINVDKGYVYQIQDITFVDGVKPFLTQIQAMGFLLVIVTNQSGIGRGYYSEADFEHLSDWMVDTLMHEGIFISAIYHCPHAPEAHCTCRKPQPGMLLQAKDDLNIDLNASWMIGDKPSDIEAAFNAGLKQAVYWSDTPMGMVSTAEQRVLQTVHFDEILRAVSP